MVMVAANFLITTREGSFVKISPLSLLLFTTVSLLSASAPLASSRVLCGTWFVRMLMVLPEEYRGKTKAIRFTAQGEFDCKEFTFANGSHCDVKEKICRKNRYYGVDGKPSGSPDTTTRQLFGR